MSRHVSTSARSLTLVCVAAWAVAWAASPLRAEVKWRDLLDPATDADRDKTYYVIYVSIPQCDFCTKLEREVFPSQEFQALGEKALFMKFSDAADIDAKREQLAKHFDVQSFPALLVLKKAGDKREVTGRKIGFNSAADTIAFLKHQLGLAQEYRPPDPLLDAPGSLTADGNNCPPGDVACQLKSPKTIVRQATDEDVANLIKSLDKAFPGLEDKERLRLDDDGLEELLKAAGHKPMRKKNEEGYTYFMLTEEREDFTFAYAASFSSNRKRLWLTMFLTGKVDQERVPAEVMAQLLEYNRAYGPVHFSFADDKLQVSLALDNLSLTQARLQDAIGDLMRTTRETAGAWSKIAKLAATP